MTLPPCDFSNVTSYITCSLPSYKNIFFCTNKCGIEPLIKTIMTRWPNMQFYKIHEYNKVTRDMGRSNRWGPFPRAWQTSKTVVQRISAPVTRARWIVHTEWPISEILTWRGNVLQTLTGIKMETNRLRDKEWCPPPSSIRIKSLAAAIHWPAIHSERKSWKKVRIVLCTLRKLAEPALTSLDIFRRLFYEPSFLHLSMLRKHEEHEPWYLFFLSEATFYQDVGWFHVLPQITHTLTSNPNLLETALRASWDTVSLVTLLRLVPIKVPIRS